MMVVKDMLVHDERKNCHEELGAILPSTMRAHKSFFLDCTACMLLSWDYIVVNEVNVLGVKIL